MKISFFSLAIVAFLTLVSCVKDNDEHISASPDLGGDAKSTLYAPVGNATINHQQNGDIMIDNLGSSGRDGVSIDFAQYCSGDFIIEKIDLQSDSSFFALSAYDDQDRFISTLGVQKLKEKNVPFYSLQDSTISVELILLDGQTVQYSEALQAKVFPGWLRWAIMDLLSRIEDFHTNSEVHYENNTVTYSTSTTISWSGLNSGGGDIVTPDGTFFADRVTLKVSGLKRPLNRIEVQTKGFSDFTIIQDVFTNCP